MKNLKEEKNVDLCMVISDVFCAEENTVYWNQLKRQENGDIILSCEKNYITAHKIVLVKASNYFNSLINMKAEKNKVIVVHFHKETFVNLCLMLKYVYQGVAYMTNDRVSGFASFIKSLDMRGSFEVREASRKNERKSCKKKLIFPSMNLTTDVTGANDSNDSNDNYFLPLLTPTPSETSLHGQSDENNVFTIAENRKRPATLSAPEENANTSSDQEPPKKRIRFQEFLCETCNCKFYSQSELDDHQTGCLIKKLCERSSLAEMVMSEEFKHIEHC